MALNFIYPMNEVIHRRWVRLFDDAFQKRVVDA